MLVDLTPVRARISLDTNGHILRGENDGREARIARMLGHQSSSLAG